MNETYQLSLFKYVSIYEVEYFSGDYEFLSFNLDEAKAFFHANQTQIKWMGPT